MEPALKQRLVGAAVLIALAVIFLPMLIQGPAPESGVADVPLDAPRAPQGDFETRDLPLVAPEGASADGALGMDATPAPAADNPDAADLATTASAAPAPTAGGNYAVNFGSFSTVAAADKQVASLRNSQLPGYREAATVDGKTVQRVRIGPYGTRAQAESARLRAAHVRDDVGAKVVALDAEAAAPPAKPVATKPAAKPPVAPAVAAPTRTAVTTQTTPAASGTGFAVQLAAFSKSADATALRDRLRAAGFSAFTEAVNTDKGTLTRVRVGPVLNRGEADQLKAQVKSKVGLDGVVRPHP